MWICMQIMWLSWTRRDRCVHIWKISVCCRRDISDGNVLFAVWWFLNIYFVNCKTSWGSSWFYWFCKELTLMVAAELFKFVLIHIWIKKKLYYVQLIDFMYIFICLFVWSCCWCDTLITYFCDVYVFYLPCIVIAFLFLFSCFLSSMLLIHCVLDGCSYLVWWWFQEVCGTLCSFETRDSPSQGVWGIFSDDIRA